MRRPHIRMAVGIAAGIAAFAATTVLALTRNGVAMPAEVDAHHAVLLAELLRGRRLRHVEVERRHEAERGEVEGRDGGCGEIANRQLTLSYGSDGTQNVNDTVPNWRGVPPCGS